MRNINILNNLDISLGYNCVSSNPFDFVLTSKIKDIYREIVTIFVYKNEMINSENIYKYIVTSLHDYEEIVYKYNIPRKKIFISSIENIENDIEFIIKKYISKNIETFSKIKVSKDAVKWNTTSEKVKLQNQDDYLIINSSLEKSEVEYIHYEKITGFSDLNGVCVSLDKNQNYDIGIEGDVCGDIQTNFCFITFSDKEIVNNEQVAINRILHFNSNEVEKSAKIVIRVCGRGRVTIKKIKIIDKDMDFKPNDYLVLTNIYPSNEDLYRNGFVHRRVKNYEEYGVNCDVFTITKNKFLGSYKFDGITVNYGDEEVLIKYLKKNNYKKILIHFVNKNMINSIEKSEVDSSVIVWIHGHETERWQRRIFNYSEEEILQNKEKWAKQDDIKMDFMKKIYTDKNIKFVFVSKWYKEEVAEIDTNCKVVNSTIIPNVIDTSVFNYEVKRADKRKKILTIRPFSSKKYANDLSVNAILELSKEEFFSELEFNIFGKGSFFYDVLKPIEEFQNVKIHNEFLTQEQISKYHSENGIFLCPTRLDAQGVSMCEAMSSGLVPVTSGVTAIPEYVPPNSGILANEEDYKGLADGIKKLYYNHDLFNDMSKNASEFIRKKCGVDEVIKSEIEIIKE